MQKSKRNKKFLVHHIVLGIWAVIVILPIWTMIINSFKTITAQYCKAVIFLCISKTVFLSPLFQLFSLLFSDQWHRMRL